LPGDTTKLMLEKNVFSEPIFSLCASKLRQVYPARIPQYTGCLNS